MKKTLISLAILTAWAALAVSPAWAVTTRYEELNSLKDWLEGDTRWVEISAMGELSPGPLLKEHRTGEQQVWDVLAHSSGKYFIATGIHGKVLVLEKGKVSTALETGQVIASSLAEGQDGNVYVGTAPGGQVYLISPGGTSRLFCKLEDEYVWTLAVGKDGVLYAGTGPKGMVFAIDRDGKGRKVKELENDQVVRLVVGPSGKLYAGTAKKGALYEIDPSRDYASKVLAAFPEWELSGLAAAPDGSIVLGLNSLRIRAKKPELIKKEAEGEGQDENAHDEEKRNSDAQSSLVMARGKGQVARVTPAGLTEVLFQEDRLFISDIMVAPGGEIIFTTGPEGRVLAISADNEISLLDDLPESQASALAAENGELSAIATANPGVVYTVEEGTSSNAEYVTRVIDARGPSDWGRIRWRSEGGKVSGKFGVSTRSGNVEQPDDSWSEWEKVGGNGAIIKSPSARFIQVKMDWKRDATKVLSLRVYYRPLNQVPQVYEVDVRKRESRKGRFSKEELLVKWKVRNPDDDELGYRLEYKREGSDVWLPISDKLLKEDNYKWDTSNVPDGRYRLRVVATDELSNPAGSEKTSSYITRPFLVDNRKPRIMDLKYHGGVVSGAAEDSFSVIGSIAYSVDGGPWKTIWPEDGFLDQTKEKFRIELGDLAGGPHEISVMARDEAGNTGIGSISVSPD